MSFLRVRYRTSLAFLAVGVAVTACGPAAPPAPPVVPQKPVAVIPDPPPDVTAIPAPAGLVLVARVAKTDAVLKTLSAWSHLPLPDASTLVGSITDDSVADAVDLSQPVDGAVSISGSIRDPKPLVAVSVPVRSFEDAKAKLGAKHKLTRGKNGQLVVEGIGRSAVNDGRKKGEKGDDDDDDTDSCVLSPAANGARLVCGDRDAIDALSPYLTRTVARQTWTSDLHIEMTPTAVREPLQQVRQMLPVLARNMLGASSPALAKLIDAGVNEVVDFVNDTNRIVVDAQLAESGVQANLRIEYGKTQSFLARIATTNPQKADAPPPAFWHLPAEADIAGFSKGSDPKLFDHPRELLGAVALEATEGAGMPEAERKAVRELVVDRMFTLFTGPLVYGKGFDAVALDKALAARKTVKADDPLAEDEAERVIAEQALGWHLVQVIDPIAKVGPVLKDWAGLWNKPEFTKWAKVQISAKRLSQMHITPPPAGVTLPKDSVHLEIVMPRADIDQIVKRGTPAIPARGNTKAVAAVPDVLKHIPRKPLTLHVIAVPDQGGTWVGFGLDGKLLAQRAASSLASAPEAGTLGKSPAADALRDVKANAAMFATVRGLLVYSVATHGSVGSPMPMLNALSDKGTSPVVATFVAQAPSETAAGGSASATVKIPRGAIESIIKIAMSAH